LLIILSIVFAAAFLGGGYYAKTQLDQKTQELQNKDLELQKVQGELEQTKLKLADLDSPAKKANDAKRISDLAALVVALNTYKTNTGTYPSTEPSMFKDEFVDLYITNKIDDFTDPNTKTAYEIVPVATVQTPPGLTLGAMQYQWPGSCEGSEFKDEDNENNAAVRVLLESGDTYCVEVEK